VYTRVAARTKGFRKKNKDITIAAAPRRSNHITTPTASVTSSRGTGYISSAWWFSPHLNFNDWNNLAI
jgi:hypothetical protein